MNEELERCYAHAMRILGYRFNSIAELRRKLRAKRFDDEIIQATLDRLMREKWLDDARFAGAFVRTRASKRLGRRRIIRELHAAGVSDETARQAVEQNVDEASERDHLVALCAKKVRLLARRHGDDYLDTDAGRNKLTVWLLNQGYDAALVTAVMKETLLAHRRSSS